MNYLDWSSINVQAIKSPFYRNLVWLRTLELIGNLVSVENTIAVDKLIECGVMYKLGMFVDMDNQGNYETSLIEKMCWIYSNLISSVDSVKCSSYISAFFMHAPVTRLVELSIKAPNLSIQREALWIFANLLTLASPNQIKNCWEVCQLETGSYGGYGDEEDV